MAQPHCHGLALGELSGHGTRSSTCTGVRSTTARPAVHLEIDHQLELRWLLDWQVPRLGTSKPARSGSAVKAGSGIATEIPAKSRPGLTQAWSLDSSIASQAITAGLEASWSTPSLRGSSPSATDESRLSRRCSGHACSCRCAPPWVRLIPAHHRASGISFSQPPRATGTVFLPGSWLRTAPRFGAFHFA